MQQRTVVMEIRPGESVILGLPDERVTLTLKRKSGHCARLCIRAPEDVTIHRDYARAVDNREIPLTLSAV